MIIDSGQSKSEYSPYEGLEIYGVVESTILRGEFLVDNRQFVGLMKGRFIER